VRTVAREIVPVEKKLGVIVFEIKVRRFWRGETAYGEEDGVRLLVIGTSEGRLATAAEIAIERGASVTHADRIGTAMAVLRSGKGADLLIVDIATDIRDLVLRLDAGRIHVPIVACGTQNYAVAAEAAIHAGAKEYVPLPPDSEMIAAILAAVADDTRELVYRDEAMTNLIRLARALVGRTVADVERDLILETLKHCFGNRTHAANILGISIRTLRNKLAVYAADGVRVPPPNSGEVRGAA
jgi:DNA-binding NtrC family response regulator